MGRQKTVLFVCTGNSCRSVIAEGLLRKYLEDRGRTDIKVTSAGVGTIDGMPPAPLAVEVMRKKGIDASALRTKILTDDMIRNADLILVMEEFHKQEIIERIPNARSKTFLLREFKRNSQDDGLEGPEIRDPIGQPLGEYEDCFGTIKAEIERIMEFL